MDITHAGRIYFFVFILFEKFLLVFCGMTVMCPCKVPLLIYSMIISSYRYEMLHFSTLKFRIKPSWNNMDISVCTRPSYWHGPRKEESRFPKSTGNAPDTPKPPIIPNSNLKTTVYIFHQWANKMISPSIETSALSKAFAPARATDIRVWFHGAPYLKTKHIFQQGTCIQSIIHQAIETSALASCLHNGKGPWLQVFNGY